VQRVKLTRPRLVVPAAGPCTVLHPDLLWLNSVEDGIFIDPQDAVAAVEGAGLGVPAANLAATDVWDSRTGIERRAPNAFRAPRQEYIHDAAARLAPELEATRAREAPARSDLPAHVTGFFNDIVGRQTAALRQRIGARLGIVAHGPHGGQWTVDFTSAGPDFVRDGLDPEWTYRMELEDRVLYPFVTRQIPFFEDLFLSLRVRLARRPDTYNEPLYHFLYEPDPVKLETWYATH
jgi:hypothetical protein